LKIERDLASLKPDSEDGEYRRKVPNFSNFPNIKDALPNSNNPDDWKVPNKLIMELASLSSLKFRIELKSKFQTLTLPIHKTHENVPFDFADRTETGTLSRLSSLEKNFITLTCLIVNKNVALVPPIRVLMPYSYPDANPFVDCKQLYDNGDDMLPGYGMFDIIRFY
jgi:hypothetical protein